MNVGRHYFNILCWTFSLRVSFGVIRQFSLQTVLFVPFSGKFFSFVLVSLACLNFSYLPELTFSLGKPTLHERLL